MARSNAARAFSAASSSAPFRQAPPNDRCRRGRNAASAHETECSGAGNCRGSSRRHSRRSHRAGPCRCANAQVRRLRTSARMRCARSRTARGAQQRQRLTFKRRRDRLHGIKFLQRAPAGPLQIGALGCSRTRNSRRPSWLPSRPCVRRNEPSGNRHALDDLDAGRDDARRISCSTSRRSGRCASRRASAAHRASAAGSARPVRRRRIRCARNRWRPWSPPSWRLRAL